MYTAVQKRRSNTSYNQIRQKNDCIVFNLIGQKTAFTLLKAVRADGFNVQEYARKKQKNYKDMQPTQRIKVQPIGTHHNEGRDF